MEIEIWSDIACPWCYVGKRRWEAALAGLPQAEADEITVRWRSFELDPEAPAERRGDGAAHLAEKYGMSIEQASAAQERIAQAGAGEGIEMRFDLQRRGNTFDAHRIVHLAAEHDLQDAMKERLMRAYFTEGALVSDHATLGALAAEVGLPPEEVAATLDGDRFADAVRADERDAARLGISAVPTFVADRAIGISGAQSPDELRALVEQGLARARPVAPVAVGGEACGPDGC